MVFFASTLSPQIEHRAPQDDFSERDKNAQEGFNLKLSAPNEHQLQAKPCIFYRKIFFGGWHSGCSKRITHNLKLNLLTSI